MTEQLIDFPTAKLAKEKGFDEECMHYWEWYVNGVEGKVHGPLAHARPLIDFREWAVPLELTQKRPMLYNQAFWPTKNSDHQPWFYARPTQDLLERWLRETHGLHPMVIPVGNKKYCPCVMQEATDMMQGLPHVNGPYEQAREAAIVHALTLLP